MGQSGGRPEVEEQGKRRLTNAGTPIAEGLVTDNCRFVLGFVEGHLRLAEAKNAALFGGSAALSVALTGILASDHQFHWIVVTYLVVVLLGAFAAAIAALISFVPQTRLPRILHREGSQPLDNLLFFGDVRRYDPEQYLEALAKACGVREWVPTAFDRQVAKQIVVESRLAWLKFEWFTLGAWLLLAGLSTPVGAFAVHWCFRDGPLKDDQELSASANGV